MPTSLARSLSTRRGRFGAASTLVVLALSAAALPSALAQDAAWSPLVHGSLPPDPWKSRSNFSVIFDPVRSRLIAFGGVDAGGQVLDDVAVLERNSSRWETLPTHGWRPGPLAGHRAIYDPLRDRMVVFDGQPSPWALSLQGPATWSRLTETGSIQPSVFTNPFTMVHDPVRDGFLTVAGPAVWGFPFGTHSWVKYSPTPTAPSTRSGSVAVFDPIGDRLVFAGGHNGNVFVADAWAYGFGGSGWSRLTAPPGPRAFGVAAYDPVLRRMLVHGGVSGSGLSTELWAFDLEGSAGWSVVPTAPTSHELERHRHAAAYDPSESRWLIAGGDLAPPEASPSLRNDVLELRFDEQPAPCSELARQSEPLRVAPPPSGGGGSVIFAPTRGQILAFVPQSGSVRSIPMEGGPAWTTLLTTGPAPSPLHHRAIYDSHRNRLVVIGGDPGAVRVWALDLETLVWSELPATGPAFYDVSYASAVYDPVQDRVVVWGRAHGAAQVLAALRLESAAAHWMELIGTGSPPSRVGQTTVYDPARRRMLIFGGQGSGGYLNDVWALSLISPVWTQITSATASPARRWGAAGHFDTVRDRLVIFGGQGTSLFSDVHALDFAGPPAWRPLSVAGGAPAARYGASGSYVPHLDRLVISGGTGTGGAPQSDSWALAFTGATTDVGTSAPVRLAVAGFAPNPARRHLARVAFSLARSGPARLELFDLSGRRVAIRDLATAGAGPRLEDLAELRSLDAGVYWIRVRQGSESAIARGVLLQ